MFSNLKNRFSGTNQLSKLLSEHPPDHFNEINGKKQLKFIYEENPIDKSNPISFIFLNCLNPLFALGKLKPLTNDDIWPPRKDDRTKVVSAEFERQWKKEQERASEAEKIYGKTHPKAIPSLVTALRKGFGKRFIYSGMFEITYYCFATCIPYIVKSLYSFIQTPNEDPHTWGVSNGWLLCIAMAITIFCQSISVNSKFLQTYILGGQMRSALMTAVYAKSLRLSSTAKGTSTSGELVNLMSNDCSRVFEASMFVNTLWIAPCVLIVAMALLAREIGVSAVAPIALMLLIVPAQILFGKYISANRKRMLKFTDERVKFMQEILNGIRIVKLYAWESAVAKRINEIRSSELAELNRALLTKAVNLGILFTWQAIVTFFTFLMYSLLGNQINPLKVVVVLSFLNLIRFPISLLPNALVAVAECVISMRRIRDYLNSEELETLTNENHKQFYEPENQEFPVGSISVKDGEFRYDKATTIPILTHINFESKPGQLIAIIGSVGVGKSSLAAAFLGEMNIAQHSKLLLNGRIAYMSQKAWIRNTSVRNNILFGLPFESKRYWECVEAAALKTDLEILPDGDLTEIGESGVNLSGGQKQRLSLARCLYRAHLTDIVILDDCFSALDMSVGRHAFINGVKGVLKGKTVVLILNSHLHFLRQCDRIVVLSKVGSRSDQVTFETSKESLQRQLSSQKLQRQLSDPTATLYDSEPDGDDKDKNNGDGIDKSTIKFIPAHIAADGSFDYVSKRFPDLMRVVEAESLDEAEEGEKSGKPNPSPQPGAESVEMDDINFVTQIIQDANSNLKTNHSSDIAITVPSPTIDQVAPYIPSANLTQQTPIAVGNSPLLTPNDVTKSSSSVDGEQTQISPDKIVDIEKLKQTRKEATAEHDQEDPNKKGKELMQAEEKGVGSIESKVYLDYFRSSSSQYGIAFAVLLLTSYIISQAARMVCDNWVLIWARSSDSSSQRDYWLWTYGLILFATLFFVLSRSGMYTRVNISASQNLHDLLFVKLLHAPVTTYYDIVPLGRIINRFSRDLDQIDTLLPGYLNEVVLYTISFLGTIAMCAYVTPYFLITFVPIVAFFVWIQNFFRETSREMKRLEGTTRSPIFSQFSESISGLSTIRAFGMADSFVKTNQDLVDRNGALFVTSYLCERWLSIRLEQCSLAIVVSMCLLGVGLRQKITPSLLGLCVIYSLQMTGLLQWTVRLSIQVENTMTAVERLLQLQTIPQESSYYNPKTSPSKDWPMSGAIKFENLQMRYRPELDLVLKGVSAEIKPGEKVGVVGRTGSGKSSLMVALFRLVEPAGGSISIDDIDISTIGLYDLRSKLSIIPQDSTIFSGTVRSNLDPFNQHTDDALWRSLERVSLVDTVRALPKGLDSVVVEAGDNFSQGQKQLICIARALLRSSRILLLDEASAQIDSQTDRQIQETIRSNFKDCTMLTIAHRLETIMDCERVMVMSSGLLVEFDTPSNLLRNPNSIFYHMISAGGEELYNQMLVMADEARVRLAKERGQLVANESSQISSQKLLSPNSRQTSSQQLMSDPRFDFINAISPTPLRQRQMSRQISVESQPSVQIHNFDEFSQVTDGPT